MGCAVGNALFYAIHESRIELIECLLAAPPHGCGVDINQRSTGSTLVSPIEWAVMLGNIQAAQVLTRASHGATLVRPLHWTIQTRYNLVAGSKVVHLGATLRNAPMVALLLASDTTPEAREPLEGLTQPHVLRHACSSLAPISAHSWSQSDRRLSRKMRCWEVLYETLLSPRWVPSAAARDDAAAQLAQAVRDGGDPTAHNSHGWTCLMVAAMLSEVMAFRALVYGAVDGDGMANEHVLSCKSAAGTTALLWANWIWWLSGAECPDSDVHVHAEQHARSQLVLDEFATAGARLHESEAQALECLQQAYRIGDRVTRSLLRFDPTQLKLVRVRALEEGAESPSAARQSCDTMLHLDPRHPPELFDSDYAPAVPLETYLLQGLGDRSAAYDATAFADVGAHLWAPEAEGSVRRLVACAKVFVAEKVASGHPARPDHVFALHLYTLPTSLFWQSNAACCSFSRTAVELWRPWLYYLFDALKAASVRRTVVFRSLVLRRGTHGTMSDLLDGKSPAASQHARSHCKTAPYALGSRVLWPAFTSTTRDAGRALESCKLYSSTPLAEDEACVVFKIVTTRARDIRQFAHSPDGEELVYPPNSRFVVKGLHEATGHSIRLGSRAGHRDFGSNLEHLGMVGPTVEEARTMKRLLIELHEDRH